MLMQKIRRWTKKHRTVLIVVVCLLAIGLVGSFAVWNSDIFSSGDPTAAQQAQAYEEYLATVLPATPADATYEEAQQIALLYSELYGLYGQAYSEIANNEDDASVTLAESYSQKAMLAAANGAIYYQQAIDTAPESLGDVGMGQLYAFLASQLLYSQQTEQAGVAIEQALALAPETLAVIQFNAEYISYTEGFQAAVEYLEPIVASYPEDSNEYSSLSSQLSTYQLYAAFLASMENQSGGEEDSDGQDSDEDPTAAE